METARLHDASHRYNSVHILGNLNFLETSRIWVPGVEHVLRELAAGEENSGATARGLTMTEAIWKVVSSKAADATPSQWTICAIILAGPLLCMLQGGVGLTVNAGCIMGKGPRGHR